MRKEIDTSAQAYLRIQEKINAAKNNPFSEHSTAMDKLSHICANMPADIPEPNVILDSQGKVVG